MARLKRVRIIKKIRESSGVWRFVSLERIGARYVWDERPGHYFLEWWEGKKRRRQTAGQTPSEVLESQRRKRNELIGQMVSGGVPSLVEHEAAATPNTNACAMFLDHVRVHSPDKPRTHQRYRIVLEHFERVHGELLIPRRFLRFCELVRIVTCAIWPSCFPICWRRWPDSPVLAAPVPWWPNPCSSSSKF